AQPGDRGSRGTALGRRLVGSEVIEKLPGAARGEHRIAGDDGPDGTDDLRRAGGLEKEPRSTGVEAAQDGVVDVPRRQRDDVRRARQRADGAGRGDAVGPRHAQVHEDDVRGVRLDGGDRLVAVAYLADDVDVPGAAEDEAKAGPHERIVIDEQD